jgi:hypothetical protein
MANRTATCVYCKTSVPSDPNLAFFEDRSTETARTPCAAPGCYFVEAVHREINPHTNRPGITDHEFIPRQYDTDAYYCGCRGWD